MLPTPPRNGRTAGACPHLRPFSVASLTQFGEDCELRRRMAAESVLIVEDEHELAELIAEILRLRGLTVAVLHTGAPAPAWVREHKPDLILLDLMLPDR